MSQSQLRAMMPIAKAALRNADNSEMQVTEFVRSYGQAMLDMLVNDGSAIKVTVRMIDTANKIPPQAVLHVRLTPKGKVM